MHTTLQLRMTAQLQATINTAIELKNENEQEAQKAEDNNANGTKQQAKKTVKLNDNVKTIEPPAGKKSRKKLFGQVSLFIMGVIENHSRRAQVRFFSFPSRTRFDACACG